MKDLNQHRHQGSRRYIKIPYSSRSHPEYLNLRFKNGIFLPPNRVYFAPTKNLLKILSRDYTIYTLTLPHYKVLVSTETSLNSMWVTAAVLNNGSGYNVNRCSDLSLVGNVSCVQTTKAFVEGCQRKSPMDYSTFIPQIELKSTVYKTILLVADYILSGSTHFHPIYKSIRQLYLLYWSRSRI